MAILRSPFFGKGRMHLFVHLSIVFWLYMALQYWSSKLSDFLVFHTSGGISSRLAVFLLLIFVSATLNSWVNCPCLMLSWLLIIFVIGLSVTLGNFPNTFLKCFFHICIHSSWLAAFSFCSGSALPFTHFLFCHLHYSRLSIFYQVSNFIDLVYNVYYLFFLVCVN